MKSLNFVITLGVIMSFILLPNSIGLEVSGQQNGQANQSAGQMNQTGLTNQTAPPPAPFAEEQIQSAENQISLAEQVIESDAAQSNQSSGQSQESNQQSQQEMNEVLLNYTNNAIIALENDDEDVLQQNLLNIQETILNSTDKQIIVVPASALP